MQRTFQGFNVGGNVVFFAVNWEIAKGASSIAKWNPRLQLFWSLRAVFCAEKTSKIPDGLLGWYLVVSVRHRRPMLERVIGQLIGVYGDHVNLHLAKKRVAALLKLTVLG